KAGSTGSEPSLLKTEPKPLSNPEPKPSSPSPQAAPRQTAPVRSPGPLDDLTELMTGSPYKPTQHVIYRGTVEKMAQEMRKGKFNWSGMEDPIIVDTRGYIQQGHHRIVAARMANKP